MPRQSRNLVHICGEAEAKRPKSPRFCRLPLGLRLPLGINANWSPRTCTSRRKIHGRKPFLVSLACMLRTHESIATLPPASFSLVGPEEQQQMVRIAMAMASPANMSVSNANVFYFRYINTALKDADRSLGRCQHDRLTHTEAAMMASKLITSRFEE
ncbi:hypothetical protein VFPPC_15734 [Pochonia chlamydosporia 170]|uniref:Uncharacterized protein n=1 Tax=Pochonia chlamydosporia 170 TaxID=1380566 RepID=A0A179FQG8_METCM|nr:hypothetical protein VFPPC_15734 [Pochonia chlamydosporia 170]OAQ67824.1 hypothetical protein VFPPC_15734 [Pochonia chlamydosporia 170]